MGRLVLLLLVVGVGLWLYKNSAGGLLGSRDKETGSSAPIERARDAARKADARQAEIDRLGAESAAPRASATSFGSSPGPGDGTRAARAAGEAVSDANTTSSSGVLAIALAAPASARRK